MGEVTLVQAVQLSSYMVSVKEHVQVETTRGSIHTGVSWKPSGKGELRHGGEVGGFWKMMGELLITAIHCVWHGPWASVGHFCRWECGDEGR